jgi:hypothetical protein
MTQAEINKMTADLVNETTRISLQNADISRRIAALNGEKRGGSRSDLPEYYADVDRVGGTVYGIPSLGSIPRTKQGRELSPGSETTDSDLPEYRMTVDKENGTVGK